jgi:hypothetical protein
MSISASYMHEIYWSSFWQILVAAQKFSQEQDREASHHPAGKQGPCPALQHDVRS